MSRHHVTSLSGESIGSAFRELFCDNIKIKDSLFAQIPTLEIDTINIHIYMKVCV